MVFSVYLINSCANRAELLALSIYHLTFKLFCLVYIYKIDKIIKDLFVIKVYLFKFKSMYFIVGDAMDNIIYVRHKKIRPL